MKTFLRLGYFQWVSRIRGNKNILFFGPTMFAIPFHEYSISQNFLGFQATR